MITAKNLIIDQEFDKLLSRLKSNQHFAFVRFGDGEMHVIKNIDFSCKQWQVPFEFIAEFRKLLCDALNYNHKNYFIGLPCGCCESLDGLGNTSINNLIYLKLAKLLQHSSPTLCLSALEMNLSPVSNIIQ